MGLALDPTPRPAPVGRPRPASAPALRRRLLVDRAAAWTVTAGGMAIIASILAILLFIAYEVVPLLRSARVSVTGSRPTAVEDPRAVLVNEHRSHAAVVDGAARLRVVDLASGSIVLDEALDDRAEGSSVARVRSEPGGPELSALTADGHVVLRTLGWRVSFEGQERRVEPRLSAPLHFDLPPENGAPSAFSARVDADGSAAVAAVLADGSVMLVRRAVEENAFSGETTESWSRHHLAPPAPLERVQLDQDLRNLYGATATGDLVWWRLAGEGPPAAPQTIPGRVPVTALALLIGDRSLVVGRADGRIEIWFAVRQPDERFALTEIRSFSAQRAAIREISPSPRDKGFLARDELGTLGLYYSTSHRVLWLSEEPLPEVRALRYAPKADGALLASPGRLTRLEIDSPHPEVGLRALFGKVWYESHEEPAWVWQSSGGSDDFEPKLSLVPLMFGTLKGTLYSLLLAIPLGVFGAMYTSQFMHPDLRRYVKPTVEIMAALPSVVLGFLAGLWLAPRVERMLPALALMAVGLPLTWVLTGRAWRALPRGLRARRLDGADVLAYLAASAAVIAACLWANDLGERLLFGGSVTEWLRESTGLQYDQRNAIVVGLAMGFAVIPIIFSIAEEAFSNVPQTLVSGSLALGADRWQTVTRIVLPTASPGIFSAIMIGFGRAVGETMIVLMATGNTPILDWSPFNGFRTLSANIAVEIPEAPHGATLYRTLFLAALILFVFTFALNTAAELVRQRLRRRYAQL